MQPVGIFKIADQIGAEGKEYLGIKEGGCVQILDLDDPIYKGKSADEVLSPHMKRVFACVRLPENLVPAIKNTLVPAGMTLIPNSKGGLKRSIPDVNLYRPRNKILSLSDLGTAVGDVDLITKLRGSDSIPVISSANITESLFKDATLLPNGLGITDKNAISSGSPTVGVSQNYATYRALEADVTNLTGNLTASLETSINDATTYGDFVISLNGYTYKFTNSSSHLGVANVGNRITLNSSAGSGSAYCFMACEGSGTMRFELLDIIASVDFGYSFLWYPYGVGTAFTAYINDIILTSNDYISFYYCEDLTPIINMYNCGIMSTADMWSLDGNTNNSSSFFENITCKPTTSADWRGFDFAGSGVTVRNVVAYDIDGVNDVFNNIGNDDGYNNAEDDGSAANGNWSTGSGNITGIDSGDFTSGFAINSGSALYGAGVAPTISGHTKYINGVDISQGAGNYDIGAWGVDKGLTPIRSRFWNYYYKRRR